MTMLGVIRPAPFREDVVNAAIPGTLVDGYGSPARGRLVESPNAKGLGRVSYRAACIRCGGAGGADKWDHTGWTCFDCGGSGEGGTRTSRVYTVEAFAKLTARREKLAAKRAEAARIAMEERRAPAFEWARANEGVASALRAAAERFPMSDFLKRIVWQIDDHVVRFQRAPSEMGLAWAVGAAVQLYAQDDARAASTWIGEPGKRIEVNLTCEKLLGPYGGDRFMPGMYIALMHDDAGNRVIYKGSTPPLGKGDAARVKATVKEHGERNGEKQTVVQRIKVLDEVAS